MHIILLSLRISKDYFLTRFLSLQTAISNVSESKLFVLQVHLEKKKEITSSLSQKAVTFRAAGMYFFLSTDPLCISWTRERTSTATDKCRVRFNHFNDA